MPALASFSFSRSSPGSCEEDDAGGVEVLHYSSHVQEVLHYSSHHPLMEECPLPKDPSTLLPSNLDSSTDEELEVAPARPR